MLKKETPIKINGHHIQEQYIKIHDYPKSKAKNDARLVSLSTSNNGDIAIVMPTITALILYANDILKNENRGYKIEYDGKLIGTFLLKSPETFMNGHFENVIIQGKKI
jgi:hypothetical protein